MNRVVTDAEHAVLDAEWHEAFDALRAAGLEADADHPIAARYRAASDAVNHANRSRDHAVATGPGAVLNQALDRDLRDRWQPTNAQIELADALLASGKINPLTGHLLANKQAGFWTADVRLIHLDGVFLTFEGMMAYLRGAARRHHEETGENVIGGWAVHSAIGQWAVFEDFGSEFPARKGQS